MNTALDSISDTLAKNPTAADRTARMLRGELPIGEPPVKLREQMWTHRIPKVIIEEAKRIQRHMLKDDEGSTILSRPDSVSAVLRFAALKGCDVIEVQTTSHRGIEAAVEEMAQRFPRGKQGGDVMAFRVHPKLRARIERLQDKFKIRRDPPNLPAVVRLVLWRGLEALDVLYGAGPRTNRPRQV